MFFTKLGAAFRNRAGWTNDVHPGSQVFIHMPGDRVFSGTLQNLTSQLRPNNEIRFFHVHLPLAAYTANLQPFPVQRGPNSHRVNGYRCFIPISGNRVLVAFLEPHYVVDYEPQISFVAIRLSGQNNILYAGLLNIGEGEGPEWIPRHM